MDTRARPKRQAKVEVYLHYVWATRLREPQITPRLERAVHRSIASEAVDLGCTVVALDGTEDHVHLVDRIPGSIALAEIAKKTKGPTSRMVNVNFPEEAGFYWQEGYGAFSISPWDLERVIDYVKKQKAYHANGTITPEWEETDTAWP